jgi:hypothetical protein
MTLTILSIWAGSLLIGIGGAAAALSNRWVRAMAFIVIAGGYSLAILGNLRGDLADTLVQAGDTYVWLMMLSPTVMWLVLGVGTSLGMWKRRSGQAAA